ncbi:MAG TPA: MXAN_5187 C-terminal domain-containing protein [Polyangiaceae bacterium]|jgi:hypothetical protein|nr:MXAN_5187 C-terminal domain-containing protein [Polyangiaceae bacterium]
MKQADPIHQEVEELELKVERLKALYQQFFMGIEKIPPDVLKKEVDRSIWRLRREQLRGTRLLFKFQQIVQRYNTYQNYWARILRQMEKGTYQRDVMRAARRFGANEVLTIAGRRAQRILRRMDDEASSVPPQSGPASDDDGWDEAPTPPTGERRVPLDISDPERRTRQIYDEYLRARRASGEKVAGITYDKLSKSLAAQTQLLRQRHGAHTRIDYEVITKDGKTMIRPVIK